MLRGDLGAIERDPVAATMLAIIRSHAILGDFGLYRGVFEVAPGIEGFTPNEQSRPTSGRAGSNSLSPTAIITTYVDAAADPVLLNEAIAALLAAHPWETPVIEVSDGTVMLAERGDAVRL